MRLCRINYTLKLIIRPCKALRIAIVRQLFIMKYENEINEIINTVLPKEGWMTDEEHQEIIEETFKQMGINKQKLSDDIETGVKNGYTVKQQIELLKQVLNVA